MSLAMSFIRLLALQRAGNEDASSLIGLFLSVELVSIVNIGRIESLAGRGVNMHVLTSKPLFAS